MKKILMIFSIILLFTGCNKEEPESAMPISPVLTPSSISLEEGESKAVDISKGVAPYTVNIIPTDIVAVTISGNKLTISGIKAGNATVTVTGSDGGKANLTISVTKKTDPDAAFKADATLRWETVGEATIDINNTSYTFVADRGTLFSSTQNKWGHASLDGQRFRLIEWGTSPQMRTENGIVTVTSFQSVKEEGKIVWMKFSANGVIHRVVAEKLS